MESNPESSGDADFRNPDIRQKSRGKFIKCTARFVILRMFISHFTRFTPKRTSHISRVRFHPASCIEIRDSRDVNFDLICVVLNDEKKGKEGFSLMESYST
jgi:hypothetical protein